MSDSSSHPRRPADLLLIEDNPGDARLVEEALRDCPNANRLHIVSDGDEALDFLYRRGDHGTAPRPDLVLLDWNIPRTSGENVLTEVKADPDLKHIPVTVLTGSKDDGDVRRSYEKHANACLHKAVEPGEFMDTIEVYTDFWLSVAKLPTSEEGN